MESIAGLLESTAYMNSIYSPILLRLDNEKDKETFESLFENNRVSYINDNIFSQLKELIKCLNPSLKLNHNEYRELIDKKIGGKDITHYGVWVYYPWNQRLVHLLDETEFIEVRTNRNRYKITKEEQNILQTKKIGIAGLSVGQSIALTMAMERSCGELRLADFDTAELSNLNRIRTGVFNLGIRKTVIAAREIAEIDPFFKVKLFNDGLNTENINEFFLDGGKLDLFVEVCDGLDVKIAGRYKAKELKVPVIMDTNDRGMLDVERFDLESDRPILHGLAEGLSPNNIKGLSNEEKIPYILRMIGAEAISTRLKVSMLEVEQSINTWPQLASSVTLGGALTTDVSRRILLDQYHESGRYYIDMEELIKDKKDEAVQPLPETYIGPPELTRDEMLQDLQNFIPRTENTALAEETITEIVEAGILAPSGGNAQPWKLIYTAKGLFIFHDAHFSHSLLDFNNLGSYVGIGAVIENISIKASVFGYSIISDYFPVTGNKKIVAHIVFKKGEDSAVKNYLEPGVTIRVTNRDLAAKEIFPNDFYDYLKSSIESYQGAELYIVDDESLMKDLGEVLSKAEMLRILHPRGHYDTFTNELRWTQEEVELKRDGLDINSLGATQSELAGFKLAADTHVIALVRQLNGGMAFTKMVNKSVAVSSSLGIITMPTYSELDFVQGGRAVERIWIEANLAGVSFQPISQLVFLLARLKHGNETIDDYYKIELGKLEKAFNSLLPQLTNKQPVFMFRLAKAGPPKVRSLRRPIESSFTYLPNF
ncbi:Rv1355c family protein [Pedobacter sp. P351]|uniref:Rv1355c family protein n=1 Tax=Pedobacter superstes TaxID=3133441 RepID=UPI00309607E4